VIDKLYRGSIINHNAFLVSDQLDTFAKCQTTVTAYVLTFEEISILRRSYHNFDVAVTKTEKSLVSVENGIALDYIIKMPVEYRKYKNETNY
jgi:hypothetical protein